MTRSYALLRLMLLGADVRALRCAGDGRTYDRSPAAWSSRQFKLAYNELVEFWGSMAELVDYCFRGELPEKSMKANRAVNFLRSALLFEIPAVET